jgi:hypothetical protein
MAILRGGIRPAPKEGSYFVFFACAALNFAHRCFAFRDSFARKAADIVLLTPVPLELLVLYLFLDYH